jgi:hypothetical protein
VVAFKDTPGGSEPVVREKVTPDDADNVYSGTAAAAWLKVPKDPDAVFQAARVATIVKVPLLVDRPFTSVARTTKLAVLEVPVAVPEIKPVEERLNPGFKLPDARA